MEISTWLWSMMSSVFLLLMLMIRTGNTLKCYECNSVKEPGCTENYDHSRNPLEPLDCGEVTGGNYCIKTIGMYGGQIGTRRFCGSIDMGNYCQYVKFVDDDRTHRACIYTCNSDGCNSASSLSLSVVTVVGTVLLVAAILQ